MIETRKICPEENSAQLVSGTNLWRYVSIERLLSYLHGEVFIPSVTKLRVGDPFEGDFFFEIQEFNRALRAYCGLDHDNVIKWIHNELCSRDERDRIKINQGYENYAQKIYRTHALNFLRETRYAWCWFRDGIESAPMWESYGKGGVAIESSVGHLEAALARSDRDFAFGPTVSLDVAVPGQVLGLNAKHASLSLFPFFKRKEYKSENEVRFVTTAPVKSQVVLSMPPEAWIKEIRFYPKMSENEAEALSGVIRKFLPDVKCVQSALGTDGNSRLPGALREGSLGGWRSGTDGIPAVLKKL
jgi:hypothetical protein